MIYRLVWLTFIYFEVPAWKCCLKELPLSTHLWGTYFPDFLPCIYRAFAMFMTKPIAEYLPSCNFSVFLWAVWAILVHKLCWRCCSSSCFFAACIDVLLFRRDIIGNMLQWCTQCLQQMASTTAPAMTWLTALSSSTTQALSLHRCHSMSGYVPSTMAPWPQCIKVWWRSWLASADIWLCWSRLKYHHFFHCTLDRIAPVIVSHSVLKVHVLLNLFTTKHEITRSADLHCFLSTR